MSTEAIDRIKGYCTEVNQAQWEELVRVADEVGVKVYDMFWSFDTSSYVHLNVRNFIVKTGYTYTGRTVIPFPDFIAKLRGFEEWQPKAGEMVEVKMDCGYLGWEERKYVGSVTYEGHTIHVVLNGGYELYDTIRPLRPTITRAEAEHQLGKRIID